MKETYDNDKAIQHYTKSGEQISNASNNGIIEGFNFRKTLIEKLKANLTHKQLSIIPIGALILIEYKINNNNISEQFKKVDVDTYVQSSDKSFNIIFESNVMFLTEKNSQSKQEIVSIKYLDMSSTESSTESSVDEKTNVSCDPVLIDLYNIINL